MLTRRAIGLMLIVFGRHAAVSMFCAFWPGDVAESASFRVIREVGSLKMWALFSTAVAVIMLAGIMFSNEIVCRAALALSAAVTGAWAVGFIMALALFGVPPSPMLPIAWVALLCKDLIISSGPLTRASIIKAYK